MLAARPWINNGSSGEWRREVCPAGAGESVSGQARARVMTLVRGHGDLQARCGPRDRGGGSRRCRYPGEVRRPGAGGRLIPFLSRCHVNEQRKQITMNRAVPRNLAKLSYAAARLPLTVLDERVVARYWGQRAPVRVGFERWLGSLDVLAGRLLADEDI